MYVPCRRPGVAACSPSLPWVSSGNSLLPGRWEPGYPADARSWTVSAGRDDYRISFKISPPASSTLNNAPCWIIFADTGAVAKPYISARQYAGKISAKNMAITAFIIGKVYPSRESVLNRLQGGFQWRSVHGYPMTLYSHSTLFSQKPGMFNVVIQGSLVAKDKQVPVSESRYSIPVSSRICFMRAREYLARTGIASGIFNKCVVAVTPAKTGYPRTSFRELP